VPAYSERWARILLRTTTRDPRPATSNPGLTMTLDHWPMMGNIQDIERDAWPADYPHNNVSNAKAFLGLLGMTSQMAENDWTMYRRPIPLYRFWPPAILDQGCPALQEREKGHGLGYFFFPFAHRVPPGRCNPFHSNPCLGSEVEMMFPPHYKQIEMARYCA
jgi:hypothetical protein